MTIKLTPGTGFTKKKMRSISGDYNQRGHYWVPNILKDSFLELIIPLVVFYSL